ncbi:hypothetical protein NL676_021168 [Syzygium grande]|nr:hypothetical protein NL676_021168 [Syzygium grande]
MAGARPACLPGKANLAVAGKFEKKTVAGASASASASLSQLPLLFRSDNKLFDLASLRFGHGSANIRVGLAQQDAPFTLPHCIARYTSQVPKPNVQDQMLNSQVTTAQHMEREKAYDIIASLLKIPFLDEEVANSSSFQRKMGRVDGYNPQNVRKDSVFAWTDVYEKQSSTP